MKLKFMLLATAMFAIVATQINAQSLADSPVKVLPTAKAGIVKILYALETEDVVEVKFINASGVIATDKIKGGPYPTGLSKRYDVREINSKDFWVEVSTPRITVTYHLIPSKDRQTFVPELEKTIYNHTVVASNN